MKLLVYLHVAIKQRALQNDLQGALPGHDVNAVGRIGDFERLLGEGVDAVLALPLVLSAYKLSPALQGLRAGASDERFSLVGVGASPEPGRVQSVGALNLLGRDGTNNFVKSLVGGSPKIERVSKVEDLLPLLQMQLVEAILLPTRLFSELRAASKLALAARELAKPVSLPAVAAVTQGGSQLLPAVSRLPANVDRLVGVDSWR
jgi:hypothetical protein